MTVLPTGRRYSGVLLAALTATLIGACGGSTATPSPVHASPSAAPAATATAANVSAEPTIPLAASPTVRATVTPTAPPASATPTGTQTPSAPPSESASSTPAASAPAGSTLPSLGPADENGLAFSAPVLLGDPDSGLAVVAALARNTSDTVDSYTVAATFKNGKKTTATAAGFVNDHRPGEVRPIQLQILDGTPGASDTISLTFDTMSSQDPTTDNATVAAQVTYGSPTITGGDYPEVDVDVTNGSSTAATLTIIAAVVRDGAFVGLGYSDVDLAGGKTDTASILITGEATDTDQIMLAVDTVTLD